MTATDKWKQLKDQDLLIKILESKPGDDNKQPTWSDTVLIEFTGRQCDDPNDTDNLETSPIVQKANQWVVTFTDQCIVKALEIALLQMHQGQTALVWSTPKYALGDTQRHYGSVVLPPNSNVLYKVTLHNVLMDTGRINPYFPIQKALTKKNIANDLYSCEWPAQRDRTLVLYQKAARDMETLLHGTYLNSVEPNHPQRLQVKQLMIDSLNNIVAVFMRSKQYQAAYDAAQHVLKHDATNVKALVRAAKTRLMDPKATAMEQNAALTAAEKVIVYKDPEEVELKRLRAQWNKRQRQETTPAKE